MVEGGGFEIHCARKRTRGSNPRLSASALSAPTSGCSDSIQCVEFRGEVTEWLKVHDWNSCVGQLTGGSNPPLSATLPSRRWVRVGAQRPGPVNPARRESEQR